MQHFSAIKKIIFLILEFDSKNIPRSCECYQVVNRVLNLLIQLINVAIVGCVAFMIFRMALSIAD